MRTLSMLRHGWASRGARVATTISLALLVGLASSKGGLARGGVILFVMTLLSTYFLTSVISRARSRPGILAVELPIFLLIIGSLVFRGRDSAQLAENPLDPAAIFRLLCIALAAVLAIGGVLVSRIEGLKIRSPMTLFLTYVLIVFLGAPFSVFPLLTAFRGVELLISFLVVISAVGLAGREAFARLGSVLYLAALFLIVTVWVGVAFMSSSAIRRIASPLPWQIQGVLPSISANSVGLLGLVVALWSIVKLIEGHDPAGRSYQWSALCLGIVTLIASQYRTGMVAFIACIGVILIVRKKILLGLMAMSVTVVVLTWLPNLVSRGEEVVLQGRSESLFWSISGRVTWWERAIEVWRKSPFIGRGLLTGTRYEVFQEAGAASTVHNAWVEALVGTGLIGVSVLALCVIATMIRVGKHAFRDKQMLGLVLLTILIVRSLSGSSMESFGYTLLMFLTLAQATPIPISQSAEVMSTMKHDALQGSNRRLSLASESV